MSGAIDFIHKPINRDVVRARIDLHLTLIAREREYHQLNAELNKKVIDRTQALRDALALAKAANPAKSEFLANMSHELRTPMNALLSMAYIVGRKIYKPDLHNNVSTISQDGQRLLNLINDILDMSKHKTKKLHLGRIDFLLPSLLVITEQLLQPSAAS